MTTEAELNEAHLVVARCALLGAIRRAAQAGREMMDAVAAVSRAEMKVQSTQADQSDTQRTIFRRTTGIEGEKS